MIVVVVVALSQLHTRTEHAFAILGGQLQSYATSTVECKSLS